MMEKFDILGAGSEEQITNNGDEKWQKLMTRREFIKKLLEEGSKKSLGWTIISYFAFLESQGKSMLDNSLEEFTEFVDKICDKILSEEEEVEEEDDNEDEDVFMQTEFVDIDGHKRRMDNILRYDSNELMEIDLELMGGIKAVWKERYSNRGINRKDLIDGVERMKPWWQIMLKNFSKNEVGFNGKKYKIDRKKMLKYINLSMPESHFNYRNKKSRSIAGAVGTFQFMPRTATQAGCLMEAGFLDEREDPQKAFEACIGYLAYLLEESNGDERLMLAGYNGGFVWGYFKNKKKNERSYEDFLKYYEKFFNATLKKIREKARENSSCHKVKKGDSLYSIAKKFGCSVEEIKRMNGLKSDRIMVGSKLVINKNEKKARIYFKKLIDRSGLLENLRYPAKFEAIYEIMQKDGFIEQLQQSKPYEFEEYVIERKGKINKLLKYIVQKGDSITSIAKRYGQTVGIIQAANNIENPDEIKSGQEIIIGSWTESLKNLAQGPEHLEMLKKLNPAIIDVTLPLPVGYVVRVPQSGLKMAKK